ncbi:MAG: methylated-DNA--[protein]-cysteine S-methyltransferase [Firmicutes bacterium]|nr:methylated-DNA--[protein]-cysteine S-methyltransferase [Bacillota bacterium]MCL2177582.1 methylated-DNA--[protein]-cysteine S-methyltransferase [Bacillota bacterium]
MINILTKEYPIGRLTIVSENGYIVRLLHESEASDIKQGNDIYNLCEVLLKAATELDEYFAGARQKFSVPLKPHGTDFFKEVWRVMVSDVTFGTTVFYGELATKLNRPKAARAVGLANNKNPIPIFIPCHRIVGKNGNLTGFRWGLNIKQKLLEIESVQTKPQ